MEDAGIPSHYQTGPLPLDGRTIDFFPDGGVARPEPKWLRLRGNRVMPEEIYRNALHLPPDAQPDAATAAYIEETLYGFLVNGGYELAAVGAVVTPDGIDVQIDEGQLEKVVFTGRLTFNTLRFRLQLYLEQEVFNRPALERQIALLSEKIGLPVVRWSLVPTPHPEHLGPQLDSLGAIEGLELVHARKPYELWFFFEESEWSVGPGVDLRSGYIDGLEVGLNYQGVGAFDDRFRIAASGGLGLRYSLDDHALYPAFSRAFLEARWFSKKVGPGRFGIWFNANLYGRQRKDLDVEDYHEANATTGLDYGIRIANGAWVTPAVGFQWTKVFDIRPMLKDPDFSRVPLDAERLRTFAELSVLWVVDPENQRWDRQHQIELAGRYYLGRALDPSVAGGLQGYGWVTERYQQVFELGWHDFWLRSRARLVFGDVLFSDELNVGELLRGVFGTFVRKAGNVEFEFRFSLNRDILKVSFFTQIAGYGEVDRRTGAEEFRLGVAAGPGFHALIQGMFQMDLYASFGFRTRWSDFHDSPFSIGFVALLNKTF
ncbi:MAG: hypothetical protein IPJ65_02255 [Archangiaceae bacterium]|nr:hypothetical protein [Archangiaceae bacterium]